MPELVQAAQENPELVVLAVNLQEARSQVAAFAEEFAMPMPILLDTEGKVRAVVPGARAANHLLYRPRRQRCFLVAGPLTPKVLAERLAEIQ